MRLQTAQYEKSMDCCKSTEDKRTYHMDENKNSGLERRGVLN